MKKIVRQQNYLKGLIESQDNKEITLQTLGSVLRAVLEPLLDKPEEGAVLYRLKSNLGLGGILKRIEFSEIEAYNLSDESENLVEKVWADTEFLCVMTHRFVSIIIWDHKTESKKYVRYYTIWNSKLQDEALDIIARNTTVNVKDLQSKFRPDRRDNILFNSSIRRLVDNLDESIKDAVLGFAEYQFKPSIYTPEVREISHEVKNQLSICDLYSEIISKYCAKNSIEDETISNAITNIKRAIKISVTSLMALKSTFQVELKETNLINIISTVEDLTKVYFECKDVEYIVQNKADVKIMCDEDKLVSVLVNLVKNAIEAFEYENDGVSELKDGKYIKIRTEKRGEFVVIKVTNNACPIQDKEKIFEKGYTTKKTGSGLGLSICKKSVEEQKGELKLVHSDEKYTEFAIKFRHFI